MEGGPAPCLSNLDPCVDSANGLIVGYLLVLTARQAASLRWIAAKNMLGQDLVILYATFLAISNFFVKVLHILCGCVTKTIENYVHSCVLKKGMAL